MQERRKNKRIELESRLIIKRLDGGAEAAEEVAEDTERIEGNFATIRKLKAEQQKELELR